MYIFAAFITVYAAICLSRSFSQRSHEHGAAGAVHLGPGRKPVHDRVRVQESDGQFAFWQLHPIREGLVEREVSKLRERTYHQGIESLFNMSWD